MVFYLSSKQFGADTSFLKEWINKHNSKILLISNALDAKGIEKINNNTRQDRILLEEIGFKVDVIDLKYYFEKSDELKKLCKNYNAFCIMGGNVFVLRQAMKYSGFDMILKEISNSENHLYIGYSAGCCVLSKDLDVYKNIDEPIGFYKNEIIYDGIGIINFIFVPHYKSNYHKVHLIDELKEICEIENYKYKTVKDGEVIIIKGKSGDVKNNEN